MLPKIWDSSMGTKINLKLTHRLLFRTYLVKGVSAALIGAVTALFPGRMFGGPVHALIGNYMPVNVFGLLWLISGICVVVGLYTNRYIVSRMGMALLVSLFATTSASMFLAQAFSIASANYMASTTVYLSLALSSFMILLEPPVNPQTAIRTQKEK